MNTELDRKKTCAFTGHRNIRPDFDAELLKSVIKRIVGMGFDTFLCGMAIGFDSVCFGILEEIRKEKDIKIIACIPCLSQSYKYNYRQKREYERMKAAADEAVIISEEYTPYCMQKRNMFMVDNCEILVCYLREDRGGTFNTVKYAEKKGVKIVRI